jgi:hypothetical protein
MFRMRMEVWMKLARICLAAVASLAWSISLSAQDAADRSADIAKYSSIMANGTMTSITVAAKEIYVSGLTDPGLARLIREQLLRNPTTKSTAKRDQKQYELWLLKALASFGLEEDKETLQQVSKQSGLVSVRKECKEELALFDWHRGKNAIMAGRANHVPGMDERVLQLLNLLKAPDFSYKNLGAERISWEKRLDPVLLDEMAAQLSALAPKAGDRAEVKVLGLYAKLLGYSENPKYLPTLETARQHASSVLLRKHTGEAIKRINDGVRR